jgi:hypothetical protein
MVCCVDSDQRDASTSRGAENRSEGTGARSTSGQLARSADAPARPGQWRYGPNSKMAASVYTANDCSAAGTAHSTSRCVTLQTAAHSPSPQRARQRGRGWAKRWPRRGPTSRTGRGQRSKTGRRMRRPHGWSGLGGCRT